MSDDLDELLQALGGGEGARVLDEALRAAPEPDAARPRAVRLLGAALEHDEARVRGVWSGTPARLGPVVAGLCGVAPFLTAVFARRPEDLLWLLEEDLSRPRDLEDLQTAADAVLGDAGDAAALRRFKYRELGRLTVRDAAAVPVSETLAEISALADVLLSRALGCAEARLEARHGPAVWTGADGSPVRLGFCVLGLGKLGSRELNYSSDVDLVHVFESPPPDVSGGTGGAGAGRALHASGSGVRCAGGRPHR